MLNKKKLIVGLGNILLGDDGIGVRCVEYLKEKRSVLDEEELKLVDGATLGFDLLEEIKPNDYVGQYPPQRSYEDEIKDCELLAFRWLSEKLGCRVYLKFTFKEDKFWLVSLHEHRKETGGG